MQEIKDDDLKAFETILNQSGVHVALGFLNRRTPYRFTGIYRFDPPMLRNVMLFDRTKPNLEVGADAQLFQTYCSIVGEKRTAFFTENAQRDDRLRDHVSKDIVLSYCGIPLKTVDGAPFGTLCHYDMVPHPLPKGEISYMESGAPLMMNKLRRIPVANPV